MITIEEQIEIFRREVTRLWSNKTLQDNSRPAFPLNCFMVFHYFLSAQASPSAAVPELFR